MLYPLQSVWIIHLLFKFVLFCAFVIEYISAVSVSKLISPQTRVVFAFHLQLPYQVEHIPHLF